MRTSQSPIVEAACAYREAGISVMPCEPGTKKPAGNWKDLQNRPLPYEKIANVFHENDNVAGIGGAVSNGYFVFDVDRFSTFNRTLAKSKVFQDMRSETWESLSASGRPHIHFRAPFAVKGRNPKTTYGVEIRAQGQYVLLPPSIYLNNGQGMLYSWLQRPSDKPLLLSQSDLDQLYRDCGLLIEEYTPGNRNEPDSHRPFGMSWKFWRILAYGKLVESGYRDRPNDGRYADSASEADFHVCLHLIQRGWNDEQITELFRSYAHTATKYRRVELFNSRYLPETIQNARRWTVEKTSAIDRQISELERLSDSIDYRAITGNPQSASTFRNVYKKTLEMAKIAGKTQNLGLACRTIAIQIGSSPITVSRMLNRGVEAKLFTLESEIWKSRSTKKYSLMAPPPGVLVHSNPPQLCWNVPFGLAPLGEEMHDAFRRTKAGKSLGKTGYAIWQVLRAEKRALFVEDLLRATMGFVHERTIRKKLKLMAHLGMINAEVDLTGRLFVSAVDAVNLNQIAVRLQTADIGRRQKERYDRERKNWKIYREEKNNSLEPSVDPETGEIL